MRRVAKWVFWVVLAGCPPINSKPCSTDNECAADQRCRRGACGPICLSDVECGDGQSCVGGICAARPQCARDTDCATGFTCSSGGQCECIDDRSCASNQQCLNGACQARKRCTADADCLSTHGRCEVTQGVCLPQCEAPQDCAPTLDPNVAFTIYACAEGTCTRRCTTDVVCGASGFICRDGLCAVADCKTASECAPQQYCTSATAGRCLSYTLCSSTPECARNFECTTFANNQCPPGFDCTQKVCLELPTCLSDGDCISGIPGTQMSKPTGYCEEGHCQPSGTCTASTQCQPGLECIGKVCVPSVCRGSGSCASGQACVDGRCANAPKPIDLVLAQVAPTNAVMLVGDTLPFTFIAYAIGGASFARMEARWEVVDEAGAPSSAATVTATGEVTALAAGRVKVRVKAEGSAIAPVEAAISIYPQSLENRRVVIIDAASHQPLAGVKVFGCVLAECAHPLEATTDQNGVASFALARDALASFTATSLAIRADNFPRYEQASVLGTTTNDLLLPLRENPVRSGAGFSAVVSFSDVSTTGTYWAGFVTTSSDDLPSVTPASLLGDSFATQLPGLTQTVPIPSTMVLYTSPGLGIPQPIKPKSLGLSQSGRRLTAAWAGRASLSLALSLRSTDFLSYLGAFDYAYDATQQYVSQPFVPDTSDVNSNGLCSNPQKCPMGTENVPDYANFTPMTYQPRRQQTLRTQVAIPKVPSAFSTVVVAVVQADAEKGVLPTGFASRAASATTTDGTRTVEPMTVRSGPAYGGVEAGKPGVWALAVNAAGTAFSGRLITADTLPTEVTVPAFLPALSGATWSTEGQSVSLGSMWASVAAAGGELARISLTGTTGRHVVYLPMTAGQTVVRWPQAPRGAVLNPAEEAEPSLEIVGYDLTPSVGGVEPLFTFGGTTLSGLGAVLDAYTRFDQP